MTDLVLIPFGSRVVALDREAFNAALARGDELSAAPQEPVALAEQRLYTAQEMEGLTGVPASWWEQAARDSRVRHYRFGKYPRFRLDETAADAKEERRSGA
jgi:hypothetical protein